ncbi:SipW-dependent-type signal peptide-containing protein [Gryllotalpicola ginsengisoli]|uniref:SipW-dependent-type signal peptide-containing protein n=1 Tax=Gryllotalpicola ginsengisoli TaxID=444608 RepID=UPI0004007C4E|nr:SipW-dependent-type signal peptide-containing protein [Gryllotalpicola ginsengisoli]
MSEMVEGAIQRKTRRRRTFAIVGALAALGVGLTASLAAWTDNEWVFGQAQNGDGLGPISTSTFEVQQNTGTDGAWTDRESEDDPGSITFTADTGALAPGSTAYASVALQTTSDSIAGDVTLGAAEEHDTSSDPDGLLFNALQLQVVTSSAEFTCNKAALTSTTTTSIVSGALAGPGATASQHLEAASGSTQYYCFAITLPADFTPATGYTEQDYMGLGVEPEWEFTSVSSAS